MKSFLKGKPSKKGKRLLIFIFATALIILTVQNPYKQRVTSYFTSSPVNSTDYTRIYPTGQNDSNIIGTPQTYRLKNENEKDHDRSRLLLPPQKSSTKKYNNVQEASGTPTPLLISTSGCKLARTNIFPAYFRQSRDWLAKKIPNCGADLQFIRFLDEREKVVRLSHYEPDNCTMWEIQRKSGNDCDFEQISHGKFTSNTFNVSAFETFMMECNGKYNFEARIPLHDQVRSKIEYWWKQKGRKRRDDKPINFLFLGIDSASRSHIHRSVPQTLKVMRSMGFQDFKGYHSFFYDTLTNLEPLLTGLKYEELQTSCKSGWTAPYDDCPFVWKILSRQSYVTLYMEDEYQSFNWMNCGGFEKQPTDYYPHPLFLALRHYRANQSEETRSCASSEPVPTFLTRYTQRWLDQFKSIVPFFAFVFFAYPTHDFDAGLPNMDSALEKLMLYLKSEPVILDNTVIVLFGDHGLRYGDFNAYGGVEPAIELLLPALFIRFPERLLQRDPTFAKNVAFNTERLLTPKDVHHTMLHILSLTGLSLHLDANPTEATVADTVFKPSLPDRTSLLLEAPSDRTCETVWIQSDKCLCNVIPNTFSLENPRVINKLLDYAVKAINEHVKAANLTAKCEKWYLPHDYSRGLISAHVMDWTRKAGNANKVGRNTTMILLQLNAEPGKGQFELKLELELSPSAEVLNIQSVSRPLRINRYGSTSHCIRPDNAQLKYMKTVCYCKGRQQYERQ